MHLESGPAQGGRGGKTGQSTAGNQNFGHLGVVSHATVGNNHFRYRRRNMVLVPERKCRTLTVPETAPLLRNSYFSFIAFFPDRAQSSIMQRRNSCSPKQIDRLRREHALLEEEVRQLRAAVQIYAEVARRMAPGPGFTTSLRVPHDLARANS